MFSTCNDCRMWRRRPTTNSRRLSLSLPRPPRYSYRTNDIRDDKKRILEVQNVDLLFRSNGEAHHTDLFQLMWRKENPQLVVRRGQVFNLKITLTRPYIEDHDSISFIFSLSDCENPSLGQGTLVAIPLTKREKLKEEHLIWSAQLESVSNNVINVKITTSVKCIVGKWSMDIDTKLSHNLTLNYSYKGLIYILFNPWNKYEEVYLQNHEERDEYVLSESGLIYRGTHTRIKPCPWKYSQFETDVLDCSIMLFNKISKVSFSSMNDPIQICRALSAAVNDQDDNGVVKGNWTDDHGGGVSPTVWTGSMKILQKYFKTKKPVKYGQCWVFAGVLTTVCRALGIPARPVSCFDCGHDSMGSLTIDYFYDEEGKYMNELQHESIWNFHVWTEVYMKRLDIGKEFDGWQVIDSTPQELSDNQFKCGPTSVHAVKNGRILTPYDGSFIFAEVNADLVYWKYIGPTQPLKLIKTDTKKIGKLILTKAVHEWDKEDITQNYKHPEDTNEERLTMMSALQKSGNSLSRFYLNENFNDIKFDLKLVDDIIIGSSFVVSLKMINKSVTKNYQVRVNLAADAITYTGKQKGEIKRIQRDITVEKNSGEEVNMTVTYNDYADKLVDQASLSASCLARVVDTDFDFYAEDDFRVRQPDIKMIVSGDPVIGKPIKIKASFINPLPIPIKKGFFSIDGPGITDKSKKKIFDAPPHEEISAEFILQPQYLGDHMVVAKFVSKELSDVDGFMRISVN